MTPVPLSLLLLIGILCVCVSTLQFNGIRKEKIRIVKQGSLGVRLGSDFKVLEVIDSAHSLLQLHDRITAVDGEAVADLEFHEFKQVLEAVEVPYELSIERLYLDEDSVQKKKDAVQFMDNNDHSSSISPSLASLENELRLHLPIVTVKGGKSVDLLNFVSEAAAFSGPFNCEYQSLRVAAPLDGCLVEAIDRKKQIYKDSIVLVKRGVCPFVAKALNAQSAGAKGIIIINTEEKIFSIVDPQAAKTTIPIVMVTKSYGKQILDMIASTGSKLVTNLPMTTRIAPPNACLGARQRELQLRDQGLTHAQMTKKGSPSTPPPSANTAPNSATQSGRSKLKDQDLPRGTERVMTPAAVDSLDSSALEALVAFNDKKYREKQETLKHEMDAHWISKSSQGTHGYDTPARSTGQEQKQELQNNSSTLTTDFGYLFIRPVEEGSKYEAVDFMALQGGVHGACMAATEAVFARLPYHYSRSSTGSSAGSGADADDIDTDGSDAGADREDVDYMSTLQTYYETFEQKISSLQNIASTESTRSVLLIDFTPLSEAEVMRGEAPEESEGIAETSPTVSIDTMDTLSSALLRLQKGGGGFRGVFFLSFPENILSYDNRSKIEAETEFYNWSFPVMRTFQDAVVAKSRDMDAFSPEPVLPIAVIPSVKSAQVRQLFRPRAAPAPESSVSLRTTLLRHCTSSDSLGDKWRDLWSVAKEVGSLPDMRVRKKIFAMMKQKYIGDPDALLYLSNTLIFVDSSAEAVARSLSQHHRLNKKAAARATASSMRVGGHAKRMQKQLELEKDKRRSISRERVAAIRAQSQSQTHANADANAKTPVPAVAADSSRAILHPAGEL